MTTTKDDYILTLIREANRLGLEGKKVVGWIPNDDAGSCWPKAIICKPADKVKNASDD